MTRVYMDHNATTPLAEAVADRMSAVLRDEFGNPSSVHHFGQRAKAAVDDARSAVADLIGADPSEVVFTSSGTESDNFAIRGVAEALEPTGRRHLVTTTIEHEAVINTFKALARRGWTTTLTNVDQSGIVSPDAAAAHLTPQTALVTVMHANNEIGTVQPVADIARLAKARGVLVHTDAVQSVGKIPVDVKALGVDLLSLSVPPLVNTTSPASPPINAATALRASSIAALARCPKWWTLDGLPNSSRSAAAIRSATSGATGVVALWSR